MAKVIGNTNQRGVIVELTPMETDLIYEGVSIVRGNQIEKLEKRLTELLAAYPRMNEIQNAMEFLEKHVNEYKEMTKEKVKTD